MPKIDFYILENDQADGQLQLACRLLEKAYQNKHRIYVNTDEIGLAHQMDELLWTYRDDSFLPHHLYGDGPEPPPPIQIGFGVTPEKQRDVLINLGNTVPDFYMQFNRVIEVVSQNEAIQTSARDRYRFYKAQGHDINTYKLKSLE